MPSICFPPVPSGWAPPPPPLHAGVHLRLLAGLRRVRLCFSLLQLAALVVLVALQALPLVNAMPQGGGEQREGGLMRLPVWEQQQWSRQRQMSAAGLPFVMFHVCSKRPCSPHQSKPTMRAAAGTPLSWQGGPASSLAAAAAVAAAAGATMAGGVAASEPEPVPEGAQRARGVHMGCSKCRALINKQCTNCNTRTFAPQQCTSLPPRFMTLPNPLPQIPPPPLPPCPHRLSPAGRVRLTRSDPERHPLIYDKWEGGGAEALNGQVALRLPAASSTHTEAELAGMVFSLRDHSNPPILGAQGRRLGFEEGALLGAAAEQPEVEAALSSLQPSSIRHIAAYCQFFAAAYLGRLGGRQGWHVHNMGGSARASGGASHPANRRNTLRSSHQLHVGARIGSGLIGFRVGGIGGLEVYVHVPHGAVWVLTRLGAGELELGPPPSDDADQRSADRLLHHCVPPPPRKPQHGLSSSFLTVMAKVRATARGLRGGSVCADLLALLLHLLPCPALPTTDLCFQLALPLSTALPMWPLPAGGSGGRQPGGGVPALRRGV